MDQPVPIPEAAQLLGVSADRARALAVSGQLPALKLGDRWFVERAALEQRLRRGVLEGRRFSPRNAWALLLLASGEQVGEIDPSVRSRLKRALARDGLVDLAPRLTDRAAPQSFRSHPGEIAHLLEDPDLIRSGISAGAEDFELVSGREADGYVQSAMLDRVVSDHALEPSGAQGNVKLRVVPDEVWSLPSGRQVAPEAAIALDLAEASDPRSARAGEKALRELDRRNRRRR
jgi:excisionase family DNA binding protein